MRLALPFRRIAPLAIALAAYTALPSLEWCPFRWDECLAACQVGPRGAAQASTAGACESATSCRPAAAQAGASCGPTAAQSASTCAGACPSSRAAAAAGLPCDPTPDRNAPIGDRAWCIHPPTDGVPARETAIRAPSAAAITLPALAYDPFTRAALRVALWVAEVYSPSEADAHARPPTRAPPLL